MWGSLVELVRATIFVASHALGGSVGLAIILISTLVRLALLPLALRNARFARAQQSKLAELKPHLDRLQKRFANDPRRLFEETQALHRANGIKMFNAETWISGLVQFPLVGALFSAVRQGLGAGIRFLWVGDLARANAVLAVLVAVLSGTAATLAPATPGAPISPRGFALIAGLGTLLFLWSASSAVALSVGAGALVSGLQNWLMARDVRRERAAQS